MRLESDGWGETLATLWTNYPPPCRPSVSELIVCTKAINTLRQANSRQPLRMLVLGSTSEFRDLGFDQGLDVTVIDYSPSYHERISGELRHKNLKERVVHETWQEMCFSGEFDLVVGDLVVGNLRNHEIDPFLQNVSRALTHRGLFVTKSFFWQDGYQAKTLPQIFEGYRAAGSPPPLFPRLIYDIAMSCVNRSDSVLRFRHMYDQLKGLRDTGFITEAELAPFMALGWQENMKFEFFIPLMSAWEALLKRHFPVVSKETGIDVYSEHFPVYVAEKQQVKVTE